MTQTNVVVIGGGFGTSFDVSKINKIIDKNKL